MVVGGQSPDYACWAVSFQEMLENYYLTRAVSSPTSDTGKQVLFGVVRLSGPTACQNKPTSIPSQISVDCKSVHL